MEEKQLTEAEEQGGEKGQRLSDDFTQGNIAGKLIKFMVPILGALVDRKSVV